MRHCADLGITRVHTFDALLEAHPLARSARALGSVRSAPRVAVVSTTGGGGAMMVDCLAVAGAEPTPPSRRPEPSWPRPASMRAAARWSTSPSPALDTK